MGQSPTYRYCGSDQLSQVTWQELLWPGEVRSVVTTFKDIGERVARLVALFFVK